MIIPWGAWQPDRAGPNSGTAAYANNVLPQIAASGGIGYGPMPSLLTASGAAALAGAPRGGISVQKLDQSWLVFFASAAKIQVLASDYTWTDIETGRTVTAGDDVSFAYFGKYLLNTDTTSGLKAYDVEAGGSNTAVSGGPTSPRVLWVSNNVVFAGSINGNTRRMESSAIGSHTNWTTEGANGVTFPDGGAIVGGRDLKNGLSIVFQEFAMRLIQFGAGAGGAIYGTTVVSNGRGAVSDRSIVAFDGMVFWWATDGIYKYVAGGTPEPIGGEKVNRWIAANVAASDYENVQGAVDPFNKVVWWRLSSTQLLGYDWQLNEFFTATVQTSALTRIATPGVTIDALVGTIDAQVEIIDSRAWQGGQPVFGALDGSYKFATFSGPALEATLRGSLLSGQRSKRFQWATPVSDATSSTLSIGVTDSIAADPMWSTPETRDSETGEVPLDDRGVHFAFEEVIPAGSEWTYSNGVDNLVAAEG